MLTLGAAGAQAAGGALDSSFGSGGIVVTDLGSESVDTVNAVAVQKDGKIVAAGWSDAEWSQGHFFALVRYTTGGKLDTSYGEGSTVLTDLGHESEVAALAVQRDGKVVAVGTGTCEDGSCFALARYTTTGRLDSSFGSGGKVLTNFGDRVRGGESQDDAYAAVLQADGKIVVAGDSNSRGPDSWEFALARYTTGGKLDRSFGSGGKVLTDLGGSASAVAIQPDGKIVVAGASRGGFTLLRYTTSGRLDATFGRAGKVLTSVGDGASAVAIRRDGKIVVAGSRDARGAHDFALARYTTRGRLDPSFGKGGKVVTDLGTANDSANALVIQADGKIVVAGRSGKEESSSGADDATAFFTLVRYTPGGKLDPSFGRGGKVLTDLGENAEASAVALQKDGKIVAAGGAGGDFAVARYLP